MNARQYRYPVGFGLVLMILTLSVGMGTSPYAFGRTTPQIESEGQSMPGTGSAVAIKVLEARASSVDIEVEIPPVSDTRALYELTLPSAEDRLADWGLSLPRSRATSFEAERVAQEGLATQLPVAALLLGAPPKGTLRVNVLRTEEQPQPSGRSPLDMAMRDVQLDAEPALITDELWLRDQRIARVVVHPFYVDGEGGQISQRQRITFRLSAEGLGLGSASASASGLDSDLGYGPHPPSPIIGSAPQRASAAHWDDAPPRNDIERVLAGALSNYGQARAWRTKRANTGARKTSASARGPLAVSDEEPPEQLLQTEGSAPRLRIGIREDGLVALSADQLRRAGMDVDALDPRRLRMTSRGEPIAIQVTGEADGRLDSDDRIRFFGKRLRPTPGTQQFLGREVPIIEGETRYTLENVYWLEMADDGDPAPRIVEREGSPSGALPVADHHRATQREQRNQHWYTWHATDDVWFWDEIGQVNGPGIDVERSYEITLDQPVPEGPPAKIRSRLAARVDPRYSSEHRHRVELRWNGDSTSFADLEWAGSRPHESVLNVEQDLAQSEIQDGANTLHLVVHFGDGLSGTQKYFDFLEVEYDRKLVTRNQKLVFETRFGDDRAFQVAGFSTPEVEVWDVSDAAAPARIVGFETRPDLPEGAGIVFDGPGDATYVAQAHAAMNQPDSIRLVRDPDLLRPTEAADYILITASSLITATKRLAAFERDVRGLRTRVVLIDDVYDAFFHGIQHPKAIQRFLAHAYTEWPAPAPSYALLVGDGHWLLEPVDSTKYGERPPQLIPPNFALVDPTQGETESTNRLATLVGGESDPLPDIAIGRLPVNEAAEVDAILDKLRAQAQRPPDQASNRHLFVADNTPDSAGNFPQVSNSFIQDMVPNDAQASRFFLDDFEDTQRCGEAVGGRACPGLTETFLTDLGNQGALFVNYVGHALPESWAGESILRTSDANRFPATDQHAMFLSWTCWDSYFCYPNRSSLSETLLRLPGAGSVAHYGPTGLGVATGHDRLQRGLYQAIFRNGVQSLGWADVAAKLELIRVNSYPDLVDTYLITGDPAILVPGARLLPDPSPTPIGTPPRQPTRPSAGSAILPYLGGS